MLIKFIVRLANFYHSEQGAANYRKHEEQDHQQESKRCKSLWWIEQSVEYNLQFLSWLDKPEYTADAQNSEYRSTTAKLHIDLKSFES